MTTSPIYERLTAPPLAILQRLPEMGRVMVILSSRGTTHERIGQVESVSVTGETLRITGACHDAVIPLAKIAKVTIDRSSMMKDKAYPRMNFRTLSGETAFAVISMDGLEPFDAALAPLPREEMDNEAEKEKPAANSRPALAEDDPLHLPFRELIGRDFPVTATFTTADISQNWQGKVEELKPAMGFLNLMTKDFHLHMEGGSVSGWQHHPGSRVALDATGQPTGLSLHSEAFI